MGHYWRSKDELISEGLVWIPSHRCASVSRPTRTYLQKLCTDTGYRLDNLPEAMDDRDEWRERVREILAGSATWLYLYSKYNWKCIFVEKIIVQLLYNYGMIFFILIIFR